MSTLQTFNNRHIDTSFLISFLIPFLKITIMLIVSFLLALSIRFSYMNIYSFTTHLVFWIWCLLLVLMCRSVYGRSLMLSHSF